MTAVAVPSAVRRGSPRGTIRVLSDGRPLWRRRGRFDYTVSDGHGGSDAGRVTVDITCVPDDPTAADDAVTRAEDSAAAAVAVLANDSDADGDPLVIGWSPSRPRDGGDHRWRGRGYLRAGPGLLQRAPRTR